ncbi:NAD(P)-binding domain-containing protein [Nocardia sp. NPDC050697]|uniref:NADPH-dependent F420 reductase n=1 Tax=Nocardia sp. NPDC050697 TaxID=3155158 RepID=UPI0033D20C5B
MRIGIVGSGAIASALGHRWVRAGHTVRLGGRDRGRAAATAERIGARPGTPAEAVADAEAVLLAVPWAAAAEVAALLPAGVTALDPTNPVAHGVGVLELPPGIAAARSIAAAAPDTHVVKAFHLFPAHTWAGTGPVPVTVALCGDDPAALRTAETLVRATGATPAVLGGLDRARQLEEAAGFVIGLAFAGHDPRAAVPGR